jgi:hypothetical protein
MVTWFYITHRLTYTLSPACDCKPRGYREAGSPQLLSILPGCDKLCGHRVVAPLWAAVPVGDKHHVVAPWKTWCLLFLIWNNPPLYRKYQPKITALETWLWQRFSKVHTVPMCRDSKRNIRFLHIRLEWLCLGYNVNSVICKFVFIFMI